VVRTRTAIIATGVAYNRLQAEGVHDLLGKGVFYGSTTAESAAQAGRDVFVVGGGNSAGQAAVHLARYAASVTLLVRGGGLDMSGYLRNQIARSDNIRFRYNVEIERTEGTRRLQALHLRHTETGLAERLPASAVFVLIGAGPKTDWLDKIVQRDDKGYILTGRHVDREAPGAVAWPEDREPLQLETSLPGVFAVGDVRGRSPRGVAAAVADGAIAVRMIWDYLETV
jgi:thioredoxin reductase (NADPH)